MSNLRYFTIEEVVANVSTIIPEAKKKDRNIFRQWAYLAERQLGFGGDTEVKTSPKLAVTDGIIVKPSDFISAVDLALLDDNNRDFRYIYKGKGKRIHPEQNRITDSERDYIKVSEDSNCFYLSSNASNITCARLKYYGLPLDEDGELKVPEHHLQAIMMYIKYMWATANESRNYNVDPHYQRWLIESSRAKSKNKMPSMLEGQQIASEWMSLIDVFRKRDY